MHSYEENNNSMNIVRQLVSAYNQKQYQQIIQFIEKQLFLLQKDPVFIQLFCGSLRQVQRVKEAAEKDGSFRPGGPTKHRG